MENDIQGVASDFMEQVKKNAGLAIALGVLIFIMGMMALGSPFIAGMSVGLLVGISLVVCGVAQFFFSFKSHQGFLSVIVAVLTIFAGGYMVINPVVASATLTIVLSAYLLASGVSEGIVAVQMKPAKGWGWALVSGILSVVLAFMIMTQFPLSGAMAIGIFLGIRLLFSGMNLMTLGFAARSASS